MSGVACDFSIRICSYQRGYFRLQIGSCWLSRGTHVQQLPIWQQHASAADEDARLAFQRFIRRGEGQKEGKGAALALFGLQPDTSPMSLN